MLWEIESLASNGLKSIPEIPALNPCLIEGRNGIGKTVAVQLIQLASGEFPVEFSARPDLWNSMRERLGDTILKISGLNGASEVSVAFTPQEWPESVDVIDFELVGNASIDGRPAPMARVAELIHVERIAGNEDLADSIDRHRAMLETQLKAAGDRVRAREREVRAAAGELLADLERVDPSMIGKSEQALTSALEEEAAAEIATQSEAKRLELVVRLSELTRKRDVVDQSALDLLGARESAAANVNQLERALAEAQEQADALAEVLRAEGGVAEKFAELSGLLRKRKEREARGARNVADSAKRLDVDASPAAVASAVDACDQELESKAAEQRLLDSAGELRVVLDALGSTMEATPLNDEILADGFAPPLTVATARHALRQRRRALAEVKTPAEVRTLAEGIQRLRARRAELLALSEMLGRLARDIELREAAQAEYDQLEKQAEAASQNADASRAADAAVGRVQHELSLAHEALASNSRKLAAQGTMSQQDAEREISQIRDMLEMDLNDSSPDVEAQRIALATADAELESARRKVAVARRSHALVQAELEHVATRLMNESWLKAITDNQPLFRASGEPDLERYRRVRAAVLEGLASIREAGVLLSRLEGLCRSYFDTRPTGSSALDEPSRALREPFSRMLASRLLEGLRSASIRDRLFDGGEVTELDPATKTLTIKHGDGRVENRPMSSYSTGEQAFAFTQARILDIQPTAEPNRLLVLDEFGAFVSADRMPDLADFLASDPVREIADQVVVILPLQVNYEVEVENTTGSLRERYEARLAQIRQRGYCAVELV